MTNFDPTNNKEVEKNNHGPENPLATPESLPSVDEVVADSQTVTQSYAEDLQKMGATKTEIEEGNTISNKFRSSVEELAQQVVVTSEISQETVQESSKEGITEENIQSPAEEMPERVRKIIPQLNSFKDVSFVLDTMGRGDLKEVVDKIEETGDKELLKDTRFLSVPSLHDKVVKLFDARFSYSDENDNKDSVPLSVSDDTDSELEKVQNVAKEPELSEKEEQEALSWDFGPSVKENESEAQEKTKQGEQKSVDVEDKKIDIVDTKDESKNTEPLKDEKQEGFESFDVVDASQKPLHNKEIPVEEVGSASWEVFEKNESPLGPNEILKQKEDACVAFQKEYCDAFDVLSDTERASKLEELQKLKDECKVAFKDVMRSDLETKKTSLVGDAESSQYKKEMSRINGEILQKYFAHEKEFNDLLGTLPSASETQSAADEKIKVPNIEKKNIVSRVLHSELMEKYRNLPVAERVILGASIAALTAFTVSAGGAVSASGLGIYWVTRVARGAVSAGSMHATNKVFDKVFSWKKERDFKNKFNASFENKDIVDEFENLKNVYAQLEKEKTIRSKMETAVRIVGSLAVGGGLAYASGILEKSIFQPSSVGQEVVQETVKKPEVPNSFDVKSTTPINPEISSTNDSVFAVQQARGNLFNQIPPKGEDTTSTILHQSESPTVSKESILPNGEKVSNSEFDGGVKTSVEDVPQSSKALTPEYLEKLDRLSEVRKGEGVWQPVYRQLEDQIHDHPDAFGITRDDLENPLKVKQALNRATAHVLVEEGYIEPDGTETRITRPGVKIQIEADSDHTSGFHIKPIEEKDMYEVKPKVVDEIPDEVSTGDVPSITESDIPEPRGLETNINGKVSFVYNTSGTPLSARYEGYDLAGVTHDKVLDSQYETMLRDRFGNSFNKGVQESIKLYGKKMADDVIVYNHLVDIGNTNDAETLEKIICSEIGDFEKHFGKGVVDYKKLPFSIKSRLDTIKPIFT